MILFVLLIATVTTRIHRDRGGAGREQPEVPDREQPEDSEVWYNALPARMEAPAGDERADDPEAFSTETSPSTVVFLERGMPPAKKVSEAPQAFSGKPKANPRAFAARHNQKGMQLFFDGRQINDELRFRYRLEDGELIRELPEARDRNFFPPGDWDFLPVPVGLNADSSPPVL